MGAEHTDLQGATVATIIGTGLFLGIIHVLTGPDHLAVLAVLSAGSSWRSCVVGMRWGCGHSTGLILVSIVFLVLGQTLDINKFGSICDGVVGMMMLVLGTWSLRHYLEKRRDFHEQVVLASYQTTKLHDSFIELPASTTNSSKAPMLQHVHEEPASSSSFDESLVTKKCCFGKCNMPSSDIKDPQTQHVRLSSSLPHSPHHVLTLGV